MVPLEAPAMVGEMASSPLACWIWTSSVRLNVVGGRTRSSSSTKTQVEQRSPQPAEAHLDATPRTDVRHRLRKRSVCQRKAVPEQGVEVAEVGGEERQVGGAAKGGHHHQPASERRGAHHPHGRQRRWGEGVPAGSRGQQQREAAEEESVCLSGERGKKTSPLVSCE
eukprot:scaffold248993_cov35-Tisochrysis_lutea.AAC.2